MMDMYDGIEKKTVEDVMIVWVFVGVSPGKNPTLLVKRKIYLVSYYL